MNCPEYSEMPCTQECFIRTIHFFVCDMHHFFVFSSFYKYFEYTIKWQLEDTGSAAFQRRQRQQLSQQQHRGLVQQR